MVRPYFRLVGRCTKAEPAVDFAGPLDFGFLRTRLAMLPTRFEVTSFAGINAPV